jgi:hypothetical protein
MNVLDHYDSSKINIGNAVELDDDNYFCKITYNNSPLVIKTNRVCYYRKKSVYKSADNYIHVSITSKDYLEWFEQFYNDLIQLFHKSSTDWFEEALTITDIECCFINPLKSNIKNNCFDVLCSIDESRMIIVDSNDNIKNLEQLNDSNIIPTFHIKGIKFNTKHFLFEIELNNLYILSDNDEVNEQSDNTNKVKEKNEKEELDEVKDELKEELKEEPNPVVFKETNNDLTELGEKNDELDEYNMDVDNLEETNLQLEELGIYEVYELINTKIKENIIQNIRNILMSKKIKTKLDLAEMVDDEDEEE